MWISAVNTRINGHFQGDNCSNFWLKFSNQNWCLCVEINKQHRNEHVFIEKGTASSGNSNPFLEKGPLLRSLLHKTTTKTSKSVQSLHSPAKSCRNTMTEVTGTNDVRVLMRDDDGVKRDLTRVREHVKEELFYKIIFIYNAKQLAEGEILDCDFQTNCIEVLSNGMLRRIPLNEAKLHLKFLWMKMMQKKCYQEWIAVKRSNAYQAVQDKFHGKLQSGVRIHVGDEC